MKIHYIRQALEFLAFKCHTTVTAVSLGIQALIARLEHDIIHSMIISYTYGYKPQLSILSFLHK